MDKDIIKHVVAKALGLQFEIYSWYDMIRDCMPEDEYSDEERQWANDNLSYELICLEDE